jgi:hypothetical protein
MTRKECFKERQMVFSKDGKRTSEEKRIEDLFILGEGSVQYP